MPELTRRAFNTFVALIALASLSFATVAQAQDDLPSWNDGASKSSIVDFVEAVTTEGGRTLSASRPDCRLRQ